MELVTCPVIQISSLGVIYQPIAFAKLFSHAYILMSLTQVRISFIILTLLSVILTHFRRNLAMSFPIIICK